jgi:uncharacterized membrane protein YagU involved in acid resistance
MSVATTFAPPTSTPRAHGRSVLLTGAARGGVAGVVGGIVFGAAMLKLHSLEGIAAIVRADTAGAGALVHVAVSAIVGAIFGMLVSRQRASAIDALLWGMAYGSLFWFVGPLTLRPLLVGDSISWTFAAAQAHVSSLIGHIAWGATTGLTWAGLRTFASGRAEENRRDVLARAMLRPVRTFVVGAVGGLASAALLTSVLPQRQRLLAPVAGGGGTNWGLALVVGAAVGALYAILVPYSTTPDSPRLGARLIQGMALGFLAWIAVALTIVPLDQSHQLPWTIDGLRPRFEVLPGYLLFGALTALLYCLLAGGGHFLFSDEVRQHDRVTAGPQRAMACARGAGAGIVGGVVFTVVLVQIGALGRVSRLIGAHSGTAGFFVHIAIATLIGITYGLLFRRDSFDARSAVGWGAAYGLLWWTLGALTLLPVLLGGDPQWSAGEAARSFPSLIGHLAYGISLGIVFYVLESRHNPWWITRGQAEAHRTNARRVQVLTAAPALWAFVTFLIAFITIVLPSNTTPTGAGY